jgi:hypothetical protein
MWKKCFITLLVFGAGGVCLPPSANAAASCTASTSGVDIPELNAAKLGNGDHIVAQTMTPRGQLQVHVSVKGKRISNPKFYIGGRLLKKTSMRHVPKDIRDCLHSSKEKAAALPGPQIAFLGSLEKLRLYSPRTDVVFKGRCKVKTSCNQSICCALATCGSAQAVWCEGF